MKTCALSSRRVPSTIAVMMSRPSPPGAGPISGSVTDVLHVNFDVRRGFQNRSRHVDHGIRSAFGDRLACGDG